MNRAPGPNDRWWGQHQQTCGGTFLKFKEPENFKDSKVKSPDIRGFFKDKGKTNIPTKTDSSRKGSVKAGTSSSGMPKGLWDANEVRSKERGGESNGLVKN